MRFLLRPGWLALVAVVAGFVVACYALLAPWQFGREAEREAQQQAIDTSFTLPPVPLGELSTSGVAPGIEWRQVTASGTYLPEAETLVRLRVIDGKPAYEVLTPFRTGEGRLLVVDRGYVTAADGSAVPAYPAPPEGTVTVTARLRQNETDPERRAILTADGHRQIYVADSRLIAGASGLALEEGYLQLAAGAPGVLSPLAVVPSSGGAPFTNLSYALQWLTFGAIAVFALVYFVRLELLQRRKGGRSGQRTAVRRALSGDDTDGETPLAERYGR